MVNKLIVIPLAFLMLMTLFNMTYNDTQLLYDSRDFTPDPLGINGTNSSVNVPGSESQNFNIWGVDGLMIILIAAIAVGITAGVRALGSGLSDTSQMLIFKSIVFFGLWGVLSALASNLLFNSGVEILMVFWLILTMIYTVGFALHVSGSATGE